MRRRKSEPWPGIVLGEAVAERRCRGTTVKQRQCCLRAITSLDGLDRKTAKVGLQDSKGVLAFQL